MHKPLPSPDNSGPLCKTKGEKPVPGESKPLIPLHSLQCKPKSSVIAPKRAVLSMIPLQCKLSSKELHISGLYSVNFLKGNIQTTLINQFLCSIKKYSNFYGQLKNILASTD